MEYNFREIEKKWQQYWKDNQTYKVTEKEGKKKFYVLDMFPYPSGMSDIRSDTSLQIFIPVLSA